MFFSHYYSSYVNLGRKKKEKSYKLPITVFGSNNGGFKEQLSINDHFPKELVINGFILGSREINMASMAACVWQRGRAGSGAWP